MRASAVSECRWRIRQTTLSLHMRLDSRQCKLTVVIAYSSPVIVEPETSGDDPKIKTHASIWRVVRQCVVFAVAAIEAQKFALSLHHFPE